VLFGIKWFSLDGFIEVTVDGSAMPYARLEKMPD
jgi:hypothetical protein